MFTYPKFDVDLEISVDITALGWPGRGDAEEDSGLGCNRLYTDLRFLPWAEAKRVSALEEVLIARVEEAEDPEAELEAIDEELSESHNHILSLDLGVAAAVVALSACRCIPFTSCNGGAFGGRHQELYPLVAFFARKEFVTLLSESATEAGVGLENGPGGCVVAFTDDIRSMRKFAESVLGRRNVFKALRVGKRTRRFALPPQGGSQQLNLEF